MRSIWWKTIANIFASVGISALSAAILVVPNSGSRTFAATMTTTMMLFGCKPKSCAPTKFGSTTKKKTPNGKIVTYYTNCSCPNKAGVLKGCTPINKCATHCGTNIKKVGGWVTKCTCKC